MSPINIFGRWRQVGRTAEPSIFWTLNPPNHTQQFSGTRTAEPSIFWTLNPPNHTQQFSGTIQIYRNWDLSEVSFEREILIHMGIQFLSVLRIPLDPQDFCFLGLDPDPQKYADPRIWSQGAKYQLTATAKKLFYSLNQNLNY